MVAQRDRFRKNEIEQLRHDFDWKHKEFTIPPYIKHAWEKYGRPELPVFSNKRFSTNSKIISEIDCILPGIISAERTPIISSVNGTIEARTINNEALVNEMS